MWWNILERDLEFGKNAQMHLAHSATANIVIIDVLKGNMASKVRISRADVPSQRFHLST